MFLPFVIWASSSLPPVKKNLDSNPVI